VRKIRARHALFDSSQKLDTVGSKLALRRHDLVMMTQDFGAEEKI
jgi:hypothetical protein